MKPLQRPSIQSFIAWLGLILTGLGVWPYSEAEAQTELFSKKRTIVAYQLGDDPAWADPQFDDRDWPRLPLGHVRFNREIWWVRVKFDLDPDQVPRPGGLHLAGLFSAEVYWDGELVAAKGRPGPDKATEQAGQLEDVYYLPESLLQPGPHVMAIRMSNQHLWTPVANPLHQLAVDTYVSPNFWRMSYYLPAISTLCALLLGAFYFLARFYKNRRRKSALWLAVLCISLLAQLFFEISRVFWQLDYVQQIWRLWLIYASVLCLGWSLLLWCTARFELSGQRHWFWLSFAVAVVVPFVIQAYDAKSAFMLIWFFVVVLMLGRVAYRQQKKGAVPMMVGAVAMVFTLLFTQIEFLDRYLFLVSILFLALLFYVEVALQERMYMAHRAMIHKRDRLELELLKQHIQPHFLVNTLTALAEWMEANPKRAIDMIDDLATEYRMLCDVAGKSLIPMSQELEMCRAYLSLMGHRFDLEFQLTVQGVDLEQPMPPAVLHTLLENALTHQQYRDTHPVFELRAEQQKDAVVYYLKTPPGSKPTKPRSRVGTGLSYVHARLSEAFGEAWRMSDGPSAEGGWTTRLELRHT